MATMPALFDYEPLPVAAPQRQPEVNHEQAMVLYTEYDRWACKLAHKHRRPGRDIEDLVQLARIGLWKAAKKYVPKSATQPVHFSVFARTWVEGEIRMATRRGAALNEGMKALEEVREPSYTMGEARALPKGSPLRGLAKMLQAGYTCEDIAALCGVMVCEVEQAVERFAHQPKREKPAETPRRVLSPWEALSVAIQKGKSQ